MATKELKFKLTAESMVNFLGIKLFRIEATASFGDVKKGDKGGWLENEEVDGNARVSGNAWVSGDAQVFGNARVSGNAWVSGNARVSGNAWVSGDARVSGDAWVFGDARVSGNAWVFGNARVSGDAQVFGNARVSGDAWVSGDAQVFGNARVSGDAWVSAKKQFTKGWFVAADDDQTPKQLTVLHGEVSQTPESPYWRNTYVLGDFEITDIPEENTTATVKDKVTQDEIVVNGVTYVKKVEGKQA